MQDASAHRSDPVTVLGVGKGCLFLHKPTTGLYYIEKRGATVLQGRISKNRFGLDTLPFERFDTERGEQKMAHGHLEGDRFVVPAINLSIPVNPFLPALARLSRSRQRAQAVIQRAQEELKQQALKSRIVCRTYHQLTHALVLLDEETGKFTLAWVNMLDSDYPKWLFAPGDLVQGSKNKFIRFLELNESGNASLRASAYPRGGEMMMEFEFQQPVACPITDKESRHIEALRQAAKGT